VQLTAEGAVSYIWSPSSGLSNAGISNPLASPSSSTTYFVSAADQYGCSQSDSFHITVFQQTDPVTTNADTTVCPGFPVSLQVNQGGSITWLPSDFLSCDNCQSPLAAPDSSITYIVSVTDLNGCFAGADSVTIQIDTTCEIIIPPSMMIPTAFSPNSDGKNDLLTVLGTGIINFQLDIYNRWGQLVFTTKTNDRGWDGTYQGMKQDVGVYVWHLDGSLEDGTHVVKNGNVTLIR
jgi:gliding motility-associated-like protein